MALAYLLDPQLQISDKSGALNVAGFLRVYLNGTDDRATTYKDFNGTLNTADIVLDNNGRAVVIADSSKAYRLEVYTRDGDLLWTQYPLNTLVGGAGGASGLVLESSDGTVDITRYSEGGLTHYDLSTDVSDSTELLDWISCAGNTLVPTNIYRPVFVDGTMELGDYGIMLAKDQYYHVTIHIDCTKVNTGAFPWTDDVRVRFRGRDIITGEFVDYQTDKVNVDYSLMLPETKELSLDVMPATDVELVVVIDDAEITGAGFSIKDMQVHRVYSGAPHVPGGVARQEWVEENYQETLTPGSGISIVNNVISATGGGSGGGDVDVYALDSMYVDYLNDNEPVIITGASWSAFRSRIDDDVAAGKPMIITFTSGSHHVDGTNAIYYGAMDGSYDWEYTFTTGVNTWNHFDFETRKNRQYRTSITYKLAKYSADLSDDRMAITKYTTRFGEFTDKIPLSSSTQGNLIGFDAGSAIPQPNAGLYAFDLYLLYLWDEAAAGSPPPGATNPQWTVDIYSPLTMDGHTSTTLVREWSGPAGGERFMVIRTSGIYHLPLSFYSFSGFVRIRNVSDLELALPAPVQQSGGFQGSYIRFARI